jgi:Ni,Fe-hydrogenase III large subunit
VHTRDAGDVLARLQVRVDEVRESFALIAQLPLDDAGGPGLIGRVSIPPLRHALGYVEGWRGEIVHWAMTDRKGNIYRWKVTDPSFHNWRAIAAAVRNAIVPDFPVINKSFNFSYSGNDR